MFLSFVISHFLKGCKFLIANITFMLRLDNTQAIFNMTLERFTVCTNRSTFTTSIHGLCTLCFISEAAWIFAMFFCVRSIFRRILASSSSEVTKIIFIHFHNFHNFHNFWRFSTSNNEFENSFWWKDFFGESADMIRKPYSRFPIEKIKLKLEQKLLITLCTIHILQNFGHGQGKADGRTDGRTRV